MQPSIRAYSGDAPYLFVSYAHADSKIVLAELVRLDAQGFNLWYDEGISPGDDWHGELAGRITNASAFLFFVSPNSVASRHCLREVNFAVTHDIDIVAVHLVETALPAGLELEIGDRQAIHRHALGAKVYAEKLNAALAARVTPGSLQPPTVRAAPAPRGRRWLGLAVAGASAVAVAIAVVAWLSQREPAAPAAGDDGVSILAELDALLAQDNIEGAYRLALTAQSSHDINLDAHWPRLTMPARIESSPSGAEVWFKLYSQPEEAWIPLGKTPIEAAALPRTYLRMRLRHGELGREIAIENPHPIFANQFGRTSAAPIELLDRLDSTEITVLEARSPVALGGFNPGGDNMVTRPTFMIDRFETTNAEFAEFVADGGYERREFWTEPFRIAPTNPADPGSAAETLSFDAAMARMVDATGRPGPATWELGRVPTGRERFPVTGISWYEAMAYARYRGKALPTAYHWAGTAFSLFEVAKPLAPALVPMANFSREPIAVDRSVSLGPEGTYDQLGNAREWMFTASGSRRYILGGSWEDAQYMATLQYVADPFDRSPTNGVRLMRHLDDHPADPSLFAPIDFSEDNFRQIEPTSDASYEALRAQMSYVETAIDVQHVSTEPDKDGRWTREHVRLESVLLGGTLDVYVFRPVTHGPHQPVVYFPGIGEFGGNSRPAPSGPAIMGFYPRHEFIVSSGRTLIWPVWHGSFDTYDGYFQAEPAERLIMSTRRLARWRTELGTVIDYVRSDASFASERIAYFGFSYGVSSGAPLVALEDRLAAAIFLSGGFQPVQMVLSETAWSVNYVRHMKLPILMINGRFDYVFPVETNQQPFFDSLGTPAQNKRHIIYDGGHTPPARNITLREIADWLDRYLGTVTPQN